MIIDQLPYLHEKPEHPIRVLLKKHEIKELLKLLPTPSSKKQLKDFTAVDKLYTGLRMVKP